MRRWFVPLLSVLAIACGGNGTGSFAGPGGTTLREGSNSLLIVRTGTATCVSTGSGPGTSIQLDVTVRAADGGWRATMTDSAAGNLLLTLTPQGSLLAGRIAGTGSLGPLSAVIGDVAVTGGPDATAGSATGTIAGNVTYSTAAGQTTCTENLWTLTPR